MQSLVMSNASISPIFLVDVTTGISMSADHAVVIDLEQLYGDDHDRFLTEDPDALIDIARRHGRSLPMTIPDYP